MTRTFAAGFLALALLAGSIFTVPSVASAEEMSLSQLVELFIALGIIPADKATQARSAIPQPTSTGCVVLTYNLYLGSSDATTNGEVTKLQQYLSSSGDYTYSSLTGYFGPATELAVQRYQSRMGIVPGGAPETTGYGVVGPQTRQVMGRSCGTADSFSAFPLTGVAPLSVGFTAQGYGTYQGLRIEFGDGTWENMHTNSTASCPADWCGYHTYTIPGTYTATLFDARDREDLAKVTITVTGDSSSNLSCSLHSDKYEYKLGETATFRWTSTNATYAAFLTDTSGKDYLKVPGDKLPAQGTQLIYLDVLGNPGVTIAVYGANGQSVTCRSTVSVTENAQSAVRVDKTSYAKGASIMVNWDTHSGVTAKDWVVIVPQGTKYTATTWPGVTGGTVPSWIYTNGSLQGPATLTAPQVAGTYEVVYYQNNGYTEFARSAIFTVN